MKQTFVLLLALLVLGCSGETEIVPSGNVVKEDRPLAGFSSIVLSGGIPLRLSQDGSDKVAVEADDNIVQHVETYAQGETLYVRMEDGVDIAYGGRDKNITVYVSAEQLDNLSVSGGSDVKFLSPFTAETLDISASGGSVINGEIYASALTYNISGGGTITLTGKCGQLDMKSSGGSSNHLFDLNAEHIGVEVSGGSIAELYAGRTLSIKSATGGSKIYYKGDAVITEMNTDNSSVVSKVEE